MIYIQMFIAGLLNYISPCILPVMPILIGYLIGEGNKNKKNKDEENKESKENINTVMKKYANIYLFITGFVITFILLGMLASSLRNNCRTIYAIFKYSIWYSCNIYGT